MPVLSSHIRRPTLLLLSLACVLAAFVTGTWLVLTQTDHLRIAPLLHLLVFVEGAILLAAGHGAWHGSKRAAVTLAGMSVAMGAARLAMSAHDVASVLVVSLQGAAVLGLLAESTRLWCDRVALAWAHADPEAQEDRRAFLRYQALAWCAAPAALAAVAYSFGVKPWVGALLGLPLSGAGIVLLLMNRRHR